MQRYFRQYIHSLVPTARLSKNLTEFLIAPLQTISRPEVATVPSDACPGRKCRPSLDQVLRMRLFRFYRAQAGVRVRLGDKLPTIEATEARSDLSPAARDRSVEIRRPLAALLTSSYL